MPQDFIGPAISPEGGREHQEGVGDDPDYPYFSGPEFGVGQSEFAFEMGVHAYRK